MQSARPQTAIKQDKKALVTLSLSINKKLLEQFPTDKYADVTIQIKSKRFELQKAHLRIETNYFDTQKVYSINDQDPEVCEGILRCMYGGSYQITSNSDLYSAYQISALFKIESLCKQIEQAFEINRKNFTYAFQLSENYNLEELRSQCYDFLEQNVDAFTQLLDIGMLKIRKNHKKTGPSDALRLKKSCFISLIEAHNTYKHNHKYLSPLDLFKVIELYSKDEEMTKELIVRLIDSNSLNSKEYEQIYYKLSLKCQSSIQQEPKIQQCHNSVKDYKIVQHYSQIHVDDYFDKQKNENIMNKKRVEELMFDNSRLHQENQKLQIALETSMQSTSNLKDSLLESIQNQLDQKMFDKDKQIQFLKEQVQNLNDMIVQKDFTIQTLQESENMFNDREETQTIVLQESDIHMVQSELQVYQPFQQSTTSLSITKISRYEFDQASQILDSKNQLHYLLDHIGITIFQQITMRKQYLGTRDGFDINSFELACNQANNLLILMKVFDYDKIVGIYIEGEFNIGELKRDILLLNISNQSLEHQNLIKLCVNNLIELDGLTIVENCDTSTENIGSRYLTGDQKFQVDDIECYSIEISNGI